MTVLEVYFVLHPRPNSLKNRDSVRMNIEIIASSLTGNIPHYTYICGAFSHMEKVLKKIL